MRKNLTFLWCVPRSVSTAFEKMMAQTGQFQVFGEPFIDVYKRSRLSKQDFAREQRKFNEICAGLIEQSHSKPVFVKDMAYHAYPFITDDIIHAANHTFLTRDPALSIPSLYRMRPDYAEAHCGFEGQFHLFQKIQAVSDKKPLVIDAEILKKRPKAAVAGFFENIGVTMPKDVLTWSRGSRDDWVGRESWHLDAINSQGFELRTRTLDVTKLPKKVRDSIRHNLPFYQQLCQHLP